MRTWEIVRAWFQPPAALVLAARELEDAKRGLLAAQSSREYADGLVPLLREQDQAVECVSEGAGGMTTLREAAQQALEALEGWANHGKWVWPESALETCKRNTIEALDALRAALAQQEQEPVTWGVDWGRDNDQSCCTIIKRHADGTQEVVAVEYGPPRREWVSLPACEDKPHAVLVEGYGYVDVRAVRAIEQACKEKNQ